MFGFLIRKTFYDMWDNFLPILLMNLGFLAIFGAIYGASMGLLALLPVLFPVNNMFIAFGSMMLLMLVGSVLYSLYAGVIACLVRDIADISKPDASKIGTYIKETWKPSLLFGVIQGVLLGLIVNAGIYYLPEGGSNFYFYLLFFFILWVYILWLIASQYFYPLQSRFNKKLRKNIRKMFILFFDNTAFTLFAVTLVALLIMGISLITLFLIPGLATLQLFYAVVLKIRVMKYDYLEENPQANRKKIPWNSLLVEEREKTGKRGLRSFIFPWKD